MDSATRVTPVYVSRFFCTATPTCKYPSNRIQNIPTHLLAFFVSGRGATSSRPSLPLVTLPTCPLNVAPLVTMSPCQLAHSS